MPDPTKIELALKEIGHATGLEVTIADGKIVKIHKGRYLLPERYGVAKEVVIREDIAG